ncbi:hypothetical protein [Daejeonella sp.]|uniref:hypothetical protein n=1 Tax=Daejeonella sp. TaxID=2805397 RepID=UPI002730DEF4|nr:hypothetical protein [Daejeonella sp.]MDP2414853.1 hypothetical protein [Daejeonella sp.]
MKSLKFNALILAVAILAASCQKNSEPDPINPNAKQTLTLQNGAVITGVYKNTILNIPEGNFTLKGYVYFEDGSEINIAAGATIKSDVSDKGALIIERGAKINAIGTAAKPIVFTSGKAVGQRNPGDWGGIIVLGKAKTNRSTEPTIEGGVGKNFGGTVDNDNSGTIKYVRIEFAGIASQPNSEINGLTLGGVGSGTTIEYVQVAYGNDDAFEIFGGTVNAKYLVAYATADDDFDFDFGYSGRIQFGVALRDPSVVDPGDAGNGVECDNDGTGTNATPATRPVLSNFTFVGPNVDNTASKNHNYANRFRRATNFVLNNSVLIGWMKGGLSLESDATYSSFVGPTITSEFKNNLIHANASTYRIGSVAVAGATDVAVKAKAEGSATITLAAAADAKLTDPFNLSSPNMLPASGSPALTGAAFAGDLTNTFFTSTTYRGAFSTTNWMAGWTSFNFTKGASGY